MCDKDKDSGQIPRPLPANKRPSGKCVSCHAETKVLLMQSELCERCFVNHVTRSVYKNGKRALEGFCRSKERRVLVVLDLDSMLSSLLMFSIFQKSNAAEKKKTLITYFFGVFNRRDRDCTHFSSAGESVLDLDSILARSDRPFSFSMDGRLQLLAEFASVRGFCSVFLPTAQEQFSSGIISLLCASETESLTSLASPVFLVDGVVFSRPLFEVSTKALLYFTFLERAASCLRGMHRKDHSPGQQTLFVLAKTFVRDLSKASPASIPNVVRTHEKLLLERTEKAFTGKSGP